ncbi:MAG: bifunctional chorismate mutase/prephenate dehydratase [Acidobacteria bacterium]|nr:MAG: bifunctional chorismate mutase/prephenate dehydratase [Acidobacteriota bacterium]
MDLNDIRKKIDMIDFEILKLLNSRMEYALRTMKFKRGTVTDEKRESEVIEYIQKHSQGLIEPEFCKRLFLQVISESKRLQAESFKLIGFQGEHGALAEVAAREFDPRLMYISCSEFREIFDAVSSGLLHYGIAAVETTAGGTISDVNQFLMESALQIIGEVKSPIHYSVLALPETDPQEIRVVYSHRQALSQCQEYLSKHDLEGRPYYDAAGAAKMLLRERPKGSAAIASRFAAHFYNLAVVEENIEDRVNITRYLVFSREAGERKGNKCSIVFSTEHKAGALFRVLREFADEGINLTRIESMPSREAPGNYVFFIDFHGSIDDPVVLRALQRVQNMAPFYRFLGCYPEAEPPKLEG